MYNVFMLFKEGLYMYKIKIKTLEQMEQLGNIIAGCAKAGSILCLDGNLGAGKTTLTQFIGKYLKVEDYITSPTFSILKEYIGVTNLYHMDAYRLSNVEEAYDIDIEKYFYSDGIFIIEWAEKIKEIIPENHIYFNISLDVFNNERSIHISGSGEFYLCIVKELLKHDYFRN